MKCATGASSETTEEARILGAPSATDRIAGGGRVSPSRNGPLEPYQRARSVPWPLGRRDGGSYRRAQTVQ